MRDCEAVSAFEVCNGARNFKDAVMRASGETLLLHGALEQSFGIGPEFAVCADLASRHLSVREDLVTGFLESGALPLSACHDAGADLGRTFGGCSAAQLLILDGGNLYMNIDAVEERAGDLGDVALDHRWSAEALARFVIEISTG